MNMDHNRQAEAKAVRRIQSRMGKTTRKWTNYLVFVLPVVLPFLIFFVWPWLNGIYYSLFKWNGISSTMEYIGLQNYINMLKDAKYASTFAFSFKFAIVDVLGANILGMIFALLLVKRIKLSNFLRACFFFPNVLATIVVGFMWQFIFTTGTTSLLELTGWSIFDIGWFSNPNMAFWAVCIVAIWMDTGYVMLIYIAGLLAVDQSIEEAAMIDGASSWKKFVHITVPMIMPSITVNLFSTIASAFKLYEIPASLTGGGPAGATTSMAYDIYLDGFGNQMAGYASAKAFVLFLVVALITLAQLALTRRKDA